VYAVIKTGAHQYTVKEGDTLRIDRLVGNPGEKIVFDQVLMVAQEKGVSFGAPLVAGAKVEATIEEQTRDPKVLVFKYKRRKNHKKMRGHKQPVTVVSIGKILAV
jgi:large subunit ribosomal protein L21